MPITIPKALPAKEILEKENIFIMDEIRAGHQDIRPLTILILNLMPEKEKTEAQLLRLLGNTPLQVNISFLRMSTHESKHTSHLHLEQFYLTFKQVESKKFDGLIITGAPVEKLQFEDVDYWPELTRIMKWSSVNVTSTMHICWGAQAGLYYHYGIGKHPLSRKCSGIYRHNVLHPNERLVRGFDEQFLAPHSRYTDVDTKQIAAIENLLILSDSTEAGVFLVASKDGKHIMVTGHPEYDLFTLAQEYDRDIKKGLKVDTPDNYFPKDNPNNRPFHSWKSHASLLFSNWLNYYVYQETPYLWE